MPDRIGWPHFLQTTGDLEINFLSHNAWKYVRPFSFAGVVIAGTVLPRLLPIALQWQAFALLVVLSTLIQVLVKTPRSRGYAATALAFFAGVFLLDPLFFVPLVVTPYLIEWIKDTLSGSVSVSVPHGWLLEVASQVGATFAARAVLSGVSSGPVLFSTLSLPSVVAAGVTYLSTSYGINSVAVVFIKRLPWRESEVARVENLVMNVVLLCVGYIVAVAWSLNFWLILPALSPLILVYRIRNMPKLRQEARMDAKTGLWNSRHFARLFQAEMERARRMQRPLALVMADLDLLREINNTYGHLAGDAVLTGVAQTIRTTIREYDVAARFGGEEFVIVLPETAPPRAKAIAERLRRAVETTRFEVAAGASSIHATMSLGVACFPDDAKTCDDLMHLADAALYQAKRMGRNCVVCASEVPSSLTVEGGPQDDVSVPYFTANTIRSRSAGR